MVHFHYALCKFRLSTVHLHYAPCTLYHVTIIKIHGQPRKFVFSPYTMQRAPGYSAIPLRTLHLGMMHSQKGSQIAESS